MNNTWCPIVTNPTPALVVAPSITAQSLVFNPDATSYPPQIITYNPFTISKTCPDETFYYVSFLTDTSLALPSFINFDFPNNQYILNINSLNHVGTYKIMLQSTIGNNKTISV